MSMRFRCANLSKILRSLLINQLDGKPHVISSQISRVLFLLMTDDGEIIKELMMNWKLCAPPARHHGVHRHLLLLMRLEIRLASRANHFLLRTGWVPSIILWCVYICEMNFFFPSALWRHVSSIWRLSCWLVATARYSTSQATNQRPSSSINRINEEAISVRYPIRGCGCLILYTDAAAGWGCPAGRRETRARRRYSKKSERQNVCAGRPVFPYLSSRFRFNLFMHHRRIKGIWSTAEG